MPVRGQTLEALKRWRKTQVADRLAWGPAWVDSGYVFTQEDGEPLHPQAVAAAFVKASKLAKVPRLRFHDLRHTAASILLRKGIHPKVVAEMLGHSDVSVTLNIYSPPRARDEGRGSRGARECLGLAVRGGCPKPA